MAGYLGAIPVPQATQHRESFTATSGQTSFSTAGYTPLFLDVYLNGSHLSPADFTATNGSDVVLASGASTGDVCDIISYTAFEIADQTFTGTTTMDVATVGGTLGVAGLVSPAAGITVVGSTTVDDILLTAVALPGSGNPSIALRNSDNNIYVQTGSGNTLSLLDSSQNTMYSVSPTLHSFSISNSEKMRINSTGAVTKPAQPSFHVVKNADQNNVAVGSSVTVVWQVESYDVGANFASNTFTAPVAGKYILTASIRVDSLDSTASEHNDMAIVTSNRNYKNIFDLRGLSSDPTYWTFTINAVADMDAGDTASVQFYQDGGTAQSDIKNDSGRTYFSGILVG